MTGLVLTFDNGPDDEVTPQVLEVLASHGCRAIFLPLGSRITTDAGQDHLHAIATAGHVIGNHTFSHPRPFGGLSRHEAIAEIEQTQVLLGDHGNQRLFRPSSGGGRLGPGVLNRDIVDHLCDGEYTLLMWHAVCEDWCRPDGSWVDLALERVKADDATVLVLHDIAGGAMSHLAEFLERVRERGIEVTVDLPVSATPIVRGKIVGSVDELLATEPYAG